MVDYNSLMRRLVSFSSRRQSYSLNRAAGTSSALKPPLHNAAYEPAYGIVSELKPANTAKEGVYTELADFSEPPFINSSVSEPGYASVHDDQLAPFSHPPLDHSHTHNIKESPNFDGYSRLVSNRNDNNGYASIGFDGDYARDRKSVV